MAAETVSLLKAALLLMAGEFFCCQLGFFFFFFAVILPEFFFQEATSHTSRFCWEVTQHDVVYVATKKISFPQEFLVSLSGSLMACKHGCKAQIILTNIVTCMQKVKKKKKKKRKCNRRVPG